MGRSFREKGNARAAALKSFGRKRNKPVQDSPASTQENETGNKGQGRHPTQPEQSRRATWRKQCLSSASNASNAAQAKAIRFPPEPSIPVPFAMESGGRHPDTCPATSRKSSTEDGVGGTLVQGACQKTRKRLTQVPNGVSRKELEFSVMHLCLEELSVK